MQAILKRLDETDVWLMDSGASRHITFQRKWLHDFQETEGEHVAVGDGSSCKVKGRGTVYIKKNVNRTWSNGRLDDVLYVPSLKRNLFSVEACDRKGQVTISPSLQEP